jgi:hypothetical protein
MDNQKRVAAGDEKKNNRQEPQKSVAPTPQPPPSVPTLPLIPMPVFPGQEPGTTAEFPYPWSGEANGDSAVLPMPGGFSPWTYGVGPGGQEMSPGFPSMFPGMEGAAIGTPPPGGGSHFGQYATHYPGSLMPDTESPGDQQGGMYMKPPTGYPEGGPYAWSDMGAGGAMGGQYGVVPYPGYPYTPPGYAEAFPGPLRLPYESPEEARFAPFYGGFYGPFIPPFFPFFW